MFLDKPCKTVHEIKITIYNFFNIRTLDFHNNIGIVMEPGPVYLTNGRSGNGLGIKGHEQVFNGCAQVLMYHIFYISKIKWSNSIL